MQPYLFSKAILVPLDGYAEPVYDARRDINLVGEAPAVDEQILFRTTTSTNAKVESFDEDY